MTDLWDSVSTLPSHPRRISVDFYQRHRLSSARGTANAACLRWADRNILQLANLAVADCEPSRSNNRQHDQIGFVRLGGVVRGGAPWGAPGPPAVSCADAGHVVGSVAQAPGPVLRGEDQRRWL